MAACGRLQHIFEKPLPESPKLLEPLSLSPWKGIKTSVDSPPPSCRDFYGDLHFKEHHHNHNHHHHDHDHDDVSESSSPSPSRSQYQSPLSLDHSSSYKSNPSPVSSSSYSFFEDVLLNHHHNHDNGDDDHNKIPYTPIKQYKHSDSFSSKNSESLSMCTEGLGFESFDDVDDLISSNDTTSFDFYNHHHHQHQNELEKTQGFSGNVQFAENSCNKESKRGVMNNNNNKGKFPPPISCIGRTGKPWVSFKSFRDGGRFILQEIRKPTQEFLHACREGGRLRLQFIHSDDEILEEEEEDDEEEEEKEKEPDDDDDDNHEIKEENGETEGKEI